MVMVPLKPPARLNEVARLMRLMDEMPGRRDRPATGDLEGPYDVWFDGGAVRYLTNINSFDFADGASAWLSSFALGLKGGVKLASGETIVFEQESQPQPAVRLPESGLCVVCRSPLPPGSTHAVTERGAAHPQCV